VDDDIVKIGIIVAVMGALVLGGVALRSTTTVPEDMGAVETTEINVLPPKSLEMLGPIYSEKAVYEDDTIRISFDAAYTADGVESRLPFWLHNTSDDVVTILWDLCSIQLPSANTVNIVHEELLNLFGPLSSPPISIAPGGDLFDAVLPLSEVDWIDDDWSVSSSVLDQGPFLFVLALETSDPCCTERQIKYYTFRFIIR
jgi:hypothetical protein